jgi:nitrite reductase/ring-hydroxylating ferredoxin subunit
MIAGWHPVALADGIAPATSAGTRLFGRELVVWRDDAGQSQVWEDRCPHRGMRLSFGFVREGRLACLYHGWQFDAAGQCRRIPAHPDLRVPATIRTTVLPSVERLGMVWAFDGPPPAAALPQAPDMPIVPVRSLALRVPARMATDALVTPRSAPFPGDIHTEQSGPLVMLRAGTHQIAAAVQALSDTESTIHIVIFGDPATYRGAGQLQVSAWAEALRRAVEGAP